MEIFARFIFVKLCRCEVSWKLNSRDIARSLLSYTAICKSCLVPEFWTSQICLLTLFAKIKFLRKISKFTVSIYCTFLRLKSHDLAQIPFLTSLCILIHNREMEMKNLLNGPWSINVLYNFSDCRLSAVLFICFYRVIKYFVMTF